MIRTRLAAVLLVACVCLPSLPSAQAQQPKPTMAGYPAIGAPAIIKLISAGAAPRRAVRYNIAPTYKGAMTMTTSMEMGGLPTAMPPMSMVMGLNVGVSSIAPNGDITMNMTFTKAEMGPGADPTIAAAVGEAMKAIVGLKGTAVVTNRGVAKSVKMDLDAANPAVSQAFSQVSQNLENMMAPFPEEAIGVGAKWEARQALDSQGMSMFQRTEFEVTAMTATSMTVNIKTEQTAPPQTISNPQLPAEAAMTLERLTSSGTGKGTIPTNALVPTMDMDLNMSMSMQVNMGGQSLPIAMEMKMKTAIAPAK